MAKRLRTIRDRLDHYVTQRWGGWPRFEKATNTPHSTVTAWRKGTIPEGKRLALLAEVGLDVHWLLTGTVPDRSPIPSPRQAPEGIRYFEELSPVVREALEDLVARNGVPNGRRPAFLADVWKWVCAPLREWRFDPALDPTGALHFQGFVDYALAAIGAYRLSRPRTFVLQVRTRGPLPHTGRKP